MRWIDLHSHLVPAVDDGASDAETSIRAIDRMIEAGVGTIVTTPHVSATELSRPAIADRRLGEIEESWNEIRERLSDRPLPRLGIGTEVLLDHPRPEVGDSRCRIVGGPYVLVEFPHSLLPPDSEDALYHIGSQGVIPIVAHVERYNVDASREKIWGEWRDAGAALQVNVGSFIGKYGRRSYDFAWELLERGWIDLVGSDYHARGDPWIEDGIAALKERGADEQIDLMYRKNPFRVLDGQPLCPVPSLRSSPGPLEGGVFGLLRRMTGRSP